MNDAGDDLEIEYRFLSEVGDSWRYRLRLDPLTLAHRLVPRAAYPSWVDLTAHQCRNCPLARDTTPRCPAAVSLVDLVEAAGALTSHEMVRVEVHTPERTVTTDTTLQRGLSSLLGLVLATSGCPHAAYFRPMARFHLPLADENETIYRATSMYLLAQYFVAREGRPADLGLSGLTAIYNDVQLVNRALAERLRVACRQDAPVNAVILLDVIAKALPLTIGSQLAELRHLFGAYVGS
ncbi:MAG: hypothetical protein P8124_00850 [Gammaproteobacteria bacterium]